MPITPVAFEFEIPGYRVDRLTCADIGRLRPLYAACADYFLLERGATPTDETICEEFESFPPNGTEADKFVFGLSAAGGELCGLLSSDRDYPVAASWWIGLFMIAEPLRGEGHAAIFLNGFLAWVREQGAKRFELAVIQGNSRAERFWAKHGFTMVREAGPRLMGSQSHMLTVLGRELGA